MSVLIFLIVFLICFGYLFMQQSKFGKTPKAERLQRIKKSSNYKNGKFQNLNFTPDLTEGATFTKVLYDFIFNKSKRIKPKETLPSKKINLHALPLEKNLLIWLGHSSYFIQTEGLRILVDPVLSGSASPIPPTTRSFKGSDNYTANDVPEIDFLLITHDHWDHLDYKTVLRLKPKIKHIVTGLGTAEHLEHWGFAKELISEMDWNESLSLTDTIKLHSTAARHFSGRGFKRNQAIWLSFVLETPKRKLYLGGDSGYDTHFKAIGLKHGPFDLAVLECGQYNKNWKYIHMMPEELVLAAKDLNAKKILPVHWAKFALAQHDWDEPIKRVKMAADKEFISLLHPHIGEEIYLDEDNQDFKEWWLEIQ